MKGTAVSTCSSSAGWVDYGSTSAFHVYSGSTSGAAGHYEPAYAAAAKRAAQQQQEANYQQALLKQLLSQGVKAPTKQEFLNQTVDQYQQSLKGKKGKSFMEEFRSYVREYKDWIFTIAIIAVVDHFFLDGALKEKLSSALGKKLDATEGKSGGA